MEREEQTVPQQARAVKQVGGVSEKEVKAFENYVNNNDINSDLRHGLDNDDIKGIDSLLKPSSKKMTLYRGVNIMWGNNDTYSYEYAEVGDILADKGFLSTSKSQKEALEFTAYGEEPTILKINVPKGTKILDINQAYKKYSKNTNVHEKEQEVVLPRDSKLKVTKVEEDVEGYIKIIHCNVLK